ncbi:DUF3892 domain-containing protein, partial [Serratia marcescens]|uniref:DUF3892 domain-containing protein n=1 Tax=Serratia marcescens TaxID=615 RepID=UPI003D9E7696
MQKIIRNLITRHRLAIECSTISRLYIYSSNFNPGYVKGYPGPLFLFSLTPMRKYAPNRGVVMSNHQVTCIKKSARQNAHERIQAIGGINADGTRWSLPQADAIAG